MNSLFRPLVFIFCFCQLLSATLASAAIVFSDADKRDLDYILRNSDAVEIIGQALLANKLIKNSSVEGVEYILFDSKAKNPAIGGLRERARRAITLFRLAEVYDFSPRERAALRNARLHLAEEAIVSVVKSEPGSAAADLIGESPVDLQPELLRPLIEQESQSSVNRDYSKYLKDLKVLLDALSVNYRVVNDKIWRIQLLAVGKSPINQRVKLLNELNGVKEVYFYPGMDSYGSYTPKTKSLRLGRLESLFLANFGRTTIRHEGLHSIISEAQDAGMDSIYNVKFYQDDVELADQAQGYGRYFSSQEIATHSSDLREYAILIARGMEQNKQSRFYLRMKRKVNMLLVLSLQVQVISERVVQSDPRLLSYKVIKSTAGDGFSVAFNITPLSRVVLPFQFQTAPSRLQVEHMIATIFPTLNDVTKKISSDLMELQELLNAKSKDFGRIAELASRPYYTARFNKRDGTSSLLDLNHSIRPWEHEIADGCRDLLDGNGNGQQ